MLSEDTTAQLLDVLRDHCSEVAGSHEKVRVALNDAATEARDEGLSGEQFVIWLKLIWDELVDEGRLSQNVDPSRTRDAVISLAIKAYYVQ